MKKTLIAAIAIVGLATGAFAQGTVIFNNNASSLVTYNGGPNDGLGVATGGAFSVALYSAAAGTTDVSAFTQIGAAGLVNPIAGRYSAGVRTTGAETAPGTTGAFLVRAWSTADGATWEEASLVVGAWEGTSAIFESLTGGAGDPAGPAVALAGSNVPFAVTQVVPEPSVIMLGLAGAGLLWMRRKK
jgi:hypothetical protein